MPAPAKLSRFGMTSPLFVFPSSSVSPFVSVSNLAKSKCLMLGVWLPVSQTLRSYTPWQCILSFVASLSALQGRQFGLVGYRDSITDMIDHATRMSCFVHFFANSELQCFGFVFLLPCSRRSSGMGQSARNMAGGEPR